MDRIDLAVDVGSFRRTAENSGCLRVETPADGMAGSSSGQRLDDSATGAQRPSGFSYNLVETERAR
jgi:hypothetical protein